MDTIKVNAQYEHLSEWIEQLPQTFFHSGTIIYDARNQIRNIVAPDGKTYTVKRYCCPRWFHRFIYTFFRASKAERAYENAVRLMALDIPTAAPVAYLLRRHGLLAESYLITEKIAFSEMLYSWEDNETTGREEWMRQFGEFTARMHEKGVLHLDYSPGNILCNEVDGKWQFAVVDINRMRFGHVSIEEGCHNLGRLWGGDAVYRMIADGYAAVRGADPETCADLMMKAHQRFWRSRKDMRRILVIRLSAMGDVAMVVSALSDAARQHPERHYTLLSKSYAQGMIPKDSNIAFLPYGSPIDWKAFDCIIDAHSVWRSWRLDWKAFLNGKKIRMVSKQRMKRWKVRHGYLPQMESMHSIYRRLLGCNIENSVLPSSIGNKQGIGIAPFAAHPGKVYPKMEEVVKMLSDQGEKIFLFGAGEEEKAILNAWAEKYPNVESLAGRYSLSEELEMIRHLRVMVTMDSGNMHLASLVGTRVVSIWGQTHPKMGFLGFGQSPDDCIQRDEKCRPCSAYGNKPCQFADYRCLNIAPEVIADKILSIK